MIGDAISSALPMLRAEAESLMTSTVRAETVTITTDPTTGADVLAATLLYRGIARVKGPGSSSLAVPATVMSESIHFPATAVPIPVGTRITVEDSANQPNLIGCVYRVTRSYLAELQAAQRAEVESWQ